MAENRKDRKIFPAYSSGGGKGGPGTWWIQVGFLGLFLAGAGVFAVKEFGSSAKKLVGGRPDYYSGGGLYGGTGSRADLAQAVGDFDEKDSVKSSGKNANIAWQPQGALEEFGNAKGGLSEPDVSAESGGAVKGKSRMAALDVKGSADGKAMPSAYKSRLNSGGLGGFSGGSGSVSEGSSGGGLGSVFGVGGAKAGITALDGRGAAAGGGRGANSARNSALDMLKSMDEASYRSRKANSKDTAHNMLAQSFDSANDSGKALKYSGAMSKLDKIDGVSPQSLKGDMNQLKSLQNSAVDALQEQDKGLKKEEQALEDQARQQTAANMQSSLMNSMMGGGMYGGYGYGGYSSPTGEKTLDGSTSGGASPAADSLSLKEVSPVEPLYYEIDNGGKMHACDGNSCAL